MIVVCSSCASKVLVPDNADVQKGKCPRCGVVLTIPAPIADDAGITSAPAPAKSSRCADEEFEEERPRSRRSWRDEDDDDFDDEDDDDEYGLPPRLRRPPDEAPGLSISAMVVGIIAVASGTCLAVACGLFSVPITGICGLVAVILGWIGMSRGGRQFAVTGITLGVIAMLMALACGVLGGTFVGWAIMQN